jgi:hypothetical protein
MKPSYPQKGSLTRRLLTMLIQSIPRKDVSIHWMLSWETNPRVPTVDPHVYFLMSHGGGEKVVVAANFEWYKKQ